MVHGDMASAYAGDVSAEEAWRRLQADPSAQMVDVRTQPEWVFAGIPDLSAMGRTVLLVSWKLYPSFALNPDFAAQIADVAPDKKAPLLFLCRTGGRSLDAAVAMTTLGYSDCYNVADGFEGPFNASRQRGSVAGWKAAGLPWVHGS